MMKRVTVWFAVVTLLLLACTAPKPPPPNTVPSPSLVKLSLEELTAQAGLIVVGTVTNQKSQWNTERSQIYTLVTLTVEEWVKGEPRGNQIAIKIPGGQVGEVSQRVGSAPGFRNGEKVLVFLRAQDGDTTSVIGGWQGKLVIENGKVVGSDVPLVELIETIKAQSSKSSR